MWLSSQAVYIFRRIIIPRSQELLTILPTLRLYYRPLILSACKFNDHFVIRITDVISEEQFVDGCQQLTRLKKSIFMSNQTALWQMCPSVVVGEWVGVYCRV